jgi:hypothetical protein
LREGLLTANPTIVLVLNIALLSIIGRAGWRQTRDGAKERTQRLPLRRSIVKNK